MDERLGTGIMTKLIRPLVDRRAGQSFPMMHGTDEQDGS